MNETQEINWTSISNKVEKISFDLFRFWTEASGINDTLIIKTEQHLHLDLKKSITNAINSLNNRADLQEKPDGWDVGFIIGFVDGNLGQHWYHEYVVKNSKEYKVYKGLRAIETYLKADEITEIRVNEIYEELLNEKSNIINLDLSLNKLDLDEEKLEVVQNLESGKILTILNNLIMKQIKIITELENNVQLPIGDYFTTFEIKKLIEDNKNRTGYNFA